MTLNINNKSCFVFDLDDTLYKEIDFVKSAYRHIASELELELSINIYDEMISIMEKGESVFDVIKSKYSFSYTIKDLVFQYRFHQPKIELLPGAIKLIKKLKAKKSTIGLITDGRSLSQRNKLEALGIVNYFDYILISEEFGSEKPNENNFKYFVNKFDAESYFYLGDNFSKDFITPNTLNWTTIGLLDDGRNIHKQDDSISFPYHPKIRIQTLTELNII